MDYNDYEQSSEIVRLLKRAFISAGEAHDFSFERTDESTGDTVEPDKVSAMTYAAVCKSEYLAAKAIYYSCPDLWRDDFSKLFAKFDEFTNELLTDFSTDHSTQWVDIQFNELKEAYTYTIGD